MTTPRPLDAIAWPVRTERLLIRPLTEGDLPVIFGIRAQPEVAHWLVAFHTTYDDFLDEWVTAERWRSTLAMELDGRVVGDLHLTVKASFAQREVMDRAAGTLGDIGWCLDPAYAGRGLATEAATELLRLCFEDLGLRRVVAAALASNAASVRVMEKIGMRIETRAVADSLHRDLGWLDGVVAAVLADEWRAKRR